MSAGILAQERSSQSTSTNLLKRVIEGDQQAWERFVAIYSSLIYVRCRRRGVPLSDTMDLVQEVMRRVFQSVGELDRDGPDRGLRRWLKTIARNVITDHFRKLAKEQHGLGQDVVHGLLLDLEAPSDEASGTLSLDKVTVVMLRPILEAARLDYEEWTWDAFWRTAVEGEKVVDVAEDLGLSHGTVRQARYKILKRLRVELDGIKDLL